MFVSNKRIVFANKTCSILSMVNNYILSESIKHNIVNCSLRLLSLSWTSAGGKIRKIDKIKKTFGSNNFKENLEDKNLIILFSLNYWRRVLVYYCTADDNSVSTKPYWWVSADSLDCCHIRLLSLKVFSFTR